VCHFQPSSGSAYTSLNRLRGTVSTMEPSSIAEQRATAVAKLKRAASLPRMKDGRRPPMHVEAVSEGERVDGEKLEEESAFESDSGKRGSPDAPEVSESGGTSEPQILAEDSEPMQEQAAQTIVEDIPGSNDKTEEAQPSEPVERPSTPGRKRRSRSRARSRGSKDLRLKTKTPPPVNNESSADEYGLEDVPPQPMISSPIPSHFAAFQGSPFLRSPVSPGPGLFYPGTTPSTPMLPSLEQIQKGIGLFRSNSVGAARMIAMHKLTKGSEPLDPFIETPSQTTLGRNNTVAGGERIALRANLLRRLGERVEKADADQISGGEEITRPVTPGTARRRKRRSRRSAVLDDRDERDREQPTTSPNTPIVPVSPFSPFFANVADMPNSSRTPVQQLIDSDTIPMGGRGVVIEDEDEDADSRPSGQIYGLPSTPARRAGTRLPHTSDAPSNFSHESTAAGVPVPFFISSQAGVYKPDVFPSSPFATPIREKPYLEEDEDVGAYRTLPVRAPSRGAANELSWVAELGMISYLSDMHRTNSL
jgi:serine/arginine repetitive matrix protein 2